MFGVDVLDFVLGAVVVVGAAAVQGTVGMGFNILAVPIMSLINPLLAPVPQLILSIPQTLASVMRERHDVDRKGVLWVVIGRLPGVAIGVWLLSVATGRLLDVLIGVLVLTAVAILVLGWHLPRTRASELGTGVFAGVSSYVSTIGGPPVALLYSRSEGPTVRATLGLIFLIGSTITLVTRVGVGDITGTDVQLGLALLPAAGLGFLLSSWLKRRARPALIRRAIFVLSSVAALALLARAVLAG